MSEETHYCLHNGDWGKLEGSLDSIKDGQKAANGKLSRVLEVVFGKDMNGGIVTQTKLNTENIGRLNRASYAIIILFLSTAIKVWFF